MNPRRLNLAKWLLTVGCCGSIVQPTRALDTSDDAVDRRIEQLVTFLKAQQITDPGPKFGSFRGERNEGVHAGGVSALATFALLHAGVPWHDPVIKRSIEHLQDHPLPGTYSRSLRAAVYAHLVDTAGSMSMRTNIRRYLQADTDWLVKALKIDGYYGYDVGGTGGDHSCAQFGVLGTWIAERAGGEVPANYWRRIAEHWVAHQQKDGSWTYSGTGPGRVTMTTAGVNTMYVLLSQLHARSEPPYRRLRGVGARRELDIKGTYQSIERGLARLAQGDLFAGGGYQLFGLERLGVASGLKYVGGVDWYREGVRRMTSLPTDTIEASFELLFLTYGRAPVLINKLQYGEGPGWNRYYRDLHHLTDWLSAQQERIYKWQIVPADAPLHDLLDAPLLLISGNDPLTLAPRHVARLADYLDFGGTIIGHADLSEVRFARSFRETFEQAFISRGWKFEPVPADHPLFRAVYGRDRADWGDELRIEAVHDGLRTPLILCTRDVAGAWHQDRTRDQQDLFELMGNVRTYAAPEYDELPRRLRKEILPTESGTGVSARISGPGVPARDSGTGVSARPAPSIGYLTIADWSPLATAVERAAPPASEKRAAPPASVARVPRPATTWRWRTFGRLFAAKHGVHTIPLPPDIDADPDIIHVSGAAAFDIPEPKWARLREAIDGGAWLMIEGDEPSFASSANSLVERIAAHFDAESVEIDSDHPLLTGEVPGAEETGKLSANRAGKAKLSTTTPPIRLTTKDDRVLAVQVPFHLLAPACGHHLYERAAYNTAGSRRLLSNLLAWRYHDLGGHGGPPHSLTADDPDRGIIAKRHPDPLVGMLEQVASADRFDAAIQLLEVIEQLAPDSPALAEARARIHRQLAEQVRVAKESRQTEDAKRLGRLLIELVPELTEAVTILDDPPSADAAPDRIPAALAEIEVEFNGQPTNARVLLTEWFRWDVERTVALERLQDLRIREDALLEQVRTIQQERAGERRGGKRPPARDRRKRDPAIEKIAGQRREIESQIAAVRQKLTDTEERLRQLDEALTALSARLAAHGVVRSDGRWVVE